MNAVYYIILFVLLAFAVYSDVKTRLIPNRIAVLILLLFIPAAVHGAVSQWPAHLIVFLVTFGACIGLYALGFIGGGDAKLIPAVALWAGPSGIPAFILGTVVAGGILALALLILHRRRAAADGEEKDSPPTVPYAVAIGAGALFVLTEPLLNAFGASLSRILWSGA